MPSHSGSEPGRDSDTLATWDPSAVFNMPPSTTMPAQPSATTSTGPRASSIVSVEVAGTLTPDAHRWYGLPAFDQVVVPGGSAPQTFVPPPASAVSTNSARVAACACVKPANSAAAPMPSPANSV